MVELAKNRVPLYHIMVLQNKWRIINNALLAPVLACSYDLNKAPDINSCRVFRHHHFPCENPGLRGMHQGISNILVINSITITTENEIFLYISYCK